MASLNRFLGTATLLLLAPAANAALIQVGPGKTYAKPCSAFANAGTGDTVQIDASGNYDGDVCAVPPDGLTIIGVNGRPHIDAAGSNAQGKGTWVVQGDNVTVENIEFSGAAVPDHNGAAIRAEGNGLTIRRCYIHDNEEGILGGSGIVVIELSEFARNGNCIDPSGCAHNMYLSNAVTEFTLRYSYTHSVTDGHLVKSRAQKNYIFSNRITGGKRHEQLRDRLSERRNGLRHRQPHRAGTELRKLDHRHLWRRGRDECRQGSLRREQHVRERPQRWDVRQCRRFRDDGGGREEQHIPRPGNGGESRQRRRVE